MKTTVRIIIALTLLLLGPLALGADRITVITDAFGDHPKLDKDWGYAALVEVAGKRILFDTGNDAARFERNVRALRIDLRSLDFVVISHRHGDHTAGLRYVRQINPRVRIYAPQDEHFGGPTPPVFFRAEPSLPSRMRYFDGDPPEVVPHGSAWGGIQFVQIGDTTEIMPGVRLISTVSDIPGVRDLRELSLAMDTPTGQVVVVGCSHPGVEKILEAAGARSARVRLLAGGFHWVTTPLPEIRRMTSALREDFRVEAIAPGHCTGELAFKELQSVFGRDYVFAGTGTVLEVPAPRVPPGSGN